MVTLAFPSLENLVRPAARHLQILSLQPRESSGGGGKSNDEIVTELAEELESQVPALLLDEDAGPTTFVVQVAG